MKYLVVGHGKFPDGMQSAIKLLLDADVLDAINLSGEITHKDFEKAVKDYIDNSDELLVFADITGGAPHQIIGDALQKSKLNNWFLLSNVSVSLVMETILMTSMEKNESKYSEIIYSVIKSSKDSIILLKK